MFIYSLEEFCDKAKEIIAKHYNDKLRYPNEPEITATDNVAIILLHSGISRNYAGMFMVLTEDSDNIYYEAEYDETHHEIYCEVYSREMVFTVDI